MSVTGAVKRYNPMKGFGFLTQSDGTDVFVHVSDCNGGAPKEGDSLTFDVEMDPKSGKMIARNVLGCTGDANAAASAKGAGKGKGSGTCHGTVKSYSGLKGWGFIDFDGVDIFLHIKDCVDGGVPQAGDWLSFDTADAGQGSGKTKATNVAGGTGWPEPKGFGKGDKGKGFGKGDYGPMWGGKGGWGGGGWGGDLGKGKGSFAWGGGKGKGDFGKGKPTGPMIPDDPNIDPPSHEELQKFCADWALNEDAKSVLLSLSPPTMHCVMREFKGGAPPGQVDGRFIVFARGVQKGRFTFKGNKGGGKGPY
mmetsp:Transcript_66410/g.168253  ORF Transcript_66410/g.168253 Transcript_66410/m.168253 type:complete len:307 (+) Transcript_66410:93-1013(+)